MLDAPAAVKLYLKRGANIHVVKRALFIAVFVQSGWGKPNILTYTGSISAFLGQTPSNMQ